MEGVGIPYGNMPCEIDRHRSPASQQHTASMAPVFLQRNFNEEVLRQAPAHAFNEADLEHARLEGHAVGLADGLSNAAASRDAAEAAALKALAGQLTASTAASAAAADCWEQSWHGPRSAPWAQ
jgi:hypothetical protein